MDDEALIRRWLHRRARVARWHRRLPQPPTPATDPAAVLALASMWLPLRRSRGVVH